MKAHHITHEAYIHKIRDIVSNRVDGELREKLLHAKLVYGCGHGTGARGITFYSRWNKKHDKQDRAVDIAEVCAFGEENPVQIAGTTIHELAHIITGAGHGHDKEWKDACRVLGLRRAHAAGQYYLPSVFDQSFRFQWASLDKPTDGKPDRAIGGLGPFGAVIAPRPCSLGIGVRGGKSRGKGSGSRLRKYTCSCGIIVRASRDDLDATCNVCGTDFKQEVK